VGVGNGPLGKGAAHVVGRLEPSSDRHAESTTRKLLVEGDIRNTELRNAASVSGGGECTQSPGLGGGVLPSLPSLGVESIRQRGTWTTQVKIVDYSCKCGMFQEAYATWACA
jgi:hypothetical protein